MDCSVARRILPAVCNYRNDLFTYLCECPLQFFFHIQCVCGAYTVNSLFFIVEIFSDAYVVRKFVTLILFHYKNFISVVYLELKCAHVSDYSENVKEPLFQSRSEALPSAAIAWAPYSTSKVLQNPLPIYLYIHDSHTHSWVSPFQHS